MKPTPSDSSSDKAAGAAVQWLSFAPYYAHLGLELQRLDGGECVIVLPRLPELGNSKGDLHGGAIASVLDIVLSQSVRSLCERGAGVATISMTLNYLEPARGQLLASGKVVRPGRTIVYAEGEVANPDGSVVARASATYRIIKPTARAT